MPTSLSFNAIWYLQQHPDVAASVLSGQVSAETHFVLYGRAEGRSASPLFDSQHYLANNPDVAQAVAQGLITAWDHFEQFGGTEGRTPTPLFDEAFYLQQNPDVAQAIANGQLSSAAQHFVLFGQSEPRPINPAIDLGRYLGANPDIANAVANGVINPFAHLVQFGVNEGRNLGNGVSLSEFSNDPSFRDAVSNGNPVQALVRVESVAPFIPAFERPSGWIPPANAPIPVDFVPPPESTLKLVVPPEVVVTPQVILPPVFEPLTLAPTTPQPSGTSSEPSTSASDNQAGAPSVSGRFVVNETQGGILSFGGSATGHITVSIDKLTGRATFVRGDIHADQTVAPLDGKTLMLAADQVLELRGAQLSAMSGTALAGSGRLVVNGEVTPQGLGQLSLFMGTQFTGSTSLFFEKSTVFEGVPGQREFKSALIQDVGFRFLLEDARIFMTVTDSLSGEERDMLQALAAGLLPPESTKLTFAVDPTPPIATDFVATSDSIGATSSEAGSLQLYDMNNLLLQSFPLVSPVGLSGVMPLSLPNNITTATLKIVDTAGNIALATRSILLGTSENDLLPANFEPDNGDQKIDYIFGFSGDDTFTYTVTDKVFNNDTLPDGLSGGEGTDTLRINSQLVNQTAEGWAIDSNQSFARVNGIEVLAAGNATGQAISIRLNEDAFTLAGIRTITLEADIIANDALSTAWNEIDASNSKNGSVSLSLIGSAGKDFMTGGAGADTFDGKAGDDTFTYRTITTLFSDDTLVDRIMGGEGSDTMHIEVVAGLYNNPVDGSFIISAADSFSRASSVETLWVSQPAKGAIELALNADAFTAGIRKVSLAGDTSVEGLNTLDASRQINSSVDLTLFGSTGVDHITGGVGRDLIQGGGSGDLIEGGLGHDTYYYASQTESMILNLAQPATGFDVVSVTSGDIFDFISDITSVRQAQYYVGAEPKQNGSDLLAQLNGYYRDAVPGPGIDAMYISIGNNDKGRFLVVDTNSDDQITSNDLIIETRGITATAPIELMLVGGNVMIRDTNDELVENLIGDDGDNVLNGTSAIERIYGAGGMDTINGGGGPDILRYAAVSDSKINNSASPAAGFDTVSITSGDVFDFALDIVAVRAAELYLGASPESNGANLLSQLNDAYKTAVPSSGIDAMYISLGNNDNGRFLVVDADDNNQITENDLMIEIVGISNNKNIQLGLIGGNVVMTEVDPPMF